MRAVALEADHLTAPCNCTIAIRPEKLNLFPVSGPVKYQDGTSDSADAYKTALLRDPDINIVTGKILQDIYIGTDTRYRIGIGKDKNMELIVRVQNYGLRSDTYFNKGDLVNVFWDSDNARLLAE